MQLLFLAFMWGSGQYLILQFLDLHTRDTILVAAAKYPPVNQITRFWLFF